MWHRQSRAALSNLPDGLLGGLFRRSALAQRLVRIRRGRRLAVSPQTELALLYAFLTREPLFNFAVEHEEFKQMENREVGRNTKRGRTGIRTEMERVKHSANSSRKQILERGWAMPHYFGNWMQTSR